jgi:deoxyhypusine synthase
MTDHQRLLCGAKIAPPPLRSGVTVREMIETSFLAYNGARLREACRLFTGKMLEPDVTIGMTLRAAEISSRVRVKRS